MSTTCDCIQRALEHIAASDDPRATRATILAALGENPILMADMYKASHAGQIPEDTSLIVSFFEARTGAELPHVVNFGLQILLNEIAAIRITQEHVDEAAQFFAQTFNAKDIFNRAGWQAIVDGGGHLPVAIHALPEGSVVPPSTPLFTIENTNPAVPWIANWMETWLMHVWYPVTVASVAFHQRQTLEKHLLAEGIPEAEVAAKARRMFVDFGMRGVTSMTSAARAGAAVLTSFEASDNTIGGKLLATEYGSTDYGKVFSSIPAAEHMTITIRGKDGEKAAFMNMLATYPTGPVSVVSDSYDYEKAVKSLWCGELVEAVNYRYEEAIKQDPEGVHAVVIRPDSGDMIKNVLLTLESAASAYGVTTKNGFKTISNKIRVIQGDGIDMNTYRVLLETLHANQWSVTNIVAGSGGGLLQKVNRDTLRCAMKASVAVVGGVEKAIWKETVGKTSKRGRLSVEMTSDGLYDTFEDGTGNPERNVLALVFKDGKKLRSETLEDVRSSVENAHARLRSKMQKVAAGVV